ncbi:DUF3265 domain-containing protein [Vibrio parahaemolyticus]|nr:DUF3265 domain-containing protein [Vibrio parahaemolyticus]EHR1160529.1 DUF3265 domain-containing protein [Vibrio parahaemolyticus]EHR5011140.1 DUF3265 domain-containing protein [Vibrio parahaemolyticus]EIO4610087.1 DUF3265 domain-containing protein [Vibrio parahaemolyticus]EIZ1368918.1 DUF3265 domain-containing protein [Vibrio parahaemolyticus]
MRLDASFQFGSCPFGFSVFSHKFRAIFQYLGVYQRFKGQRANKQFKWDSARVAFLVCGCFGVEVPCSGLVIACFTP